MLPSPLFPVPALGAGLVNGLLRRQEWVQEHLRPHAGKTLRFQVAGRTLALRVRADGLVREVPANVTADATFILDAGRLADAVRALRDRQPAGLVDQVHIEGEAALAQVVLDLVRNLRIDPEDELSRFVGDRAAVRLTGLARTLARSLHQAGERFVGNVAEYLTEETPMLLGRASFDDWRDQVAQLQRRLAAVDAALAAVERQRDGASC